MPKRATPLALDWARSPLDLVSTRREPAVVARAIRSSFASSRGKGVEAHPWRSAPQVSGSFRSAYTLTCARTPAAAAACSSRPFLLSPLSSRALSWGRVGEDGRARPRRQHAEAPRLVTPLQGAAVAGPSRGALCSGRSIPHPAPLFIGCRHDCVAACPHRISSVRTRL